MIVRANTKEKYVDTDTILYTDRLILRKPDISDIDSCYKWMKDPEVTKYTTNIGKVIHEEVEEWVRYAIFGWKNRTHYNFVIQLKDTLEVIGSVVVGHTTVLNDTLFELGYNLSREYWKQGYMTEACREVIKWTFAELGANKLLAAHHIENINSENVLKRLGFTYKQTSVYKNGQLSKFWYLDKINT